LIEFFVTTVLLLAGLPFGPVGIAVAWTVSFWVLAVPAFGYAGRPIGLGSRHVISATWRYVVASLLAGGATAAILKQLASFGELPGMMMPVTRIMITSALFLILYLCAVVLLHGGPAPLQQVARLIRDILPARKPTVLAEAADQTVG
jgi:PST family polysaccharide transporter